MLHNASLITGYVTADGVHNQENMQLSSDPFPRERVWSGDDTTTDTTYHGTTNYVRTQYWTFDVGRDEKQWILLCGLMWQWLQISDSDQLNVEVDQFDE